MKCLIKDGYAQVAAQMAAMLDEFVVRLAAVSRGDEPITNRKRKAYEVGGFSSRTGLHTSTRLVRVPSYEHYG